MATHDGDSGSDAVNIKIIYDSLQEAKDSVYADAKKAGYGVAILRSHPDRKTREIRRVHMVCSRSTIYKMASSDEPRTKNSSSVKTACP